MIWNGQLYENGQRGRAKWPSLFETLLIEAVTDSKGIYWHHTDPNTNYTLNIKIKLCVRKQFPLEWLNMLYTIFWTSNIWQLSASKMHNNYTEL